MHTDIGILYPHFKYEGMPQLQVQWNQANNSTECPVIRKSFSSGSADKNHPDECQGESGVWGKNLTLQTSHLCFSLL